MTVRTLEQLVDSLEEDLAWRKRELSNLKAMLPGRRAHTPMLLRAAICMLYAHWEGFVKLAAANYVSFVSTRRLRFADLTENFVALGLRSEIQEAGRSNRPTVHTGLISKLLSSSDELAQIDYQTSVSTGQNLNSDALREILTLLGLDYGEYLLKGPLLDQKLLANRNRIAHGERTEVGPEDFEELHIEIVQLIDRFSTDVQNAAVIASYRRTSVQ